MMRLRVLVLTLGFMGLGVTGGAGRDVLTDAQTKGVLAKLERQQMIFFVAKGAPNACGPGCSEWIAAEGAFDSTVAKRFKEFFESLPRRDLPIFFNSIGGNTQQAALMAPVLRDNRMKAGVARTLPEGCSADVANNEACRRLIQSKAEVKARLLTKGAWCNSACGIAFVGASSRQVAVDARMGIHAAVLIGDSKGKEESANWAHKRFLIQMGIDPGLVDLMNSIPFHRGRFMSRDEITRFGIETRGFYETRWFVDRKPSPNLMEQLSIRKSVTQEEKDGSGEYRAAQLIALCSLREPHLLYRREMWKNENSGGASVNLGGSTLQFVSVWANEKDIDARLVKVSYELLRKAAAEQAIEITGLFFADGELRPRITRFSTAGLSEALTRLQSHCDSQKPAQATAR